MPNGILSRPCAGGLHSRPYWHLPEPPDGHRLASIAQSGLCKILITPDGAIRGFWASVVGANAGCVLQHACAHPSMHQLAQRCPLEFRDVPHGLQEHPWALWK